ncbi:transcription-repair-coupling factor [Campylobacterota bacterium]|nr:transcription-repair-coupling factor [Campylobacterota bacterium]
MPKNLPQAAHIAASLFSFIKENPSFSGAIVSGDKEALWCADAIRLLEREPFILPDLRASFGDDLRSYQEEMIAISETLGGFYASKNRAKFLIAPIRTAVKYLPSRELFGDFALSFGDEIDLNALKIKLINWGYNAVDVVEQKGEASFRGEVIDIFSAGRESPIRVLLDGSQIESIREFDLATQKSVKTELETFTIRPALFALEGGEIEKLESLIENDESNSFIKDAPSLGFWKLREMGFAVAICDLAQFCFAGGAGGAGDLCAEIDEIYETPNGLIDRADLEQIAIAKGGAYTALEVSSPKTLLEFHRTKAITIALEYETQLKAHEISLPISTQISQHGQHGQHGVKLLFCSSALSLIGGDELIISLNKSVKQKKRRKIFKILLDDLKAGDLVVHENYGIGRFLGLEQVKLLGGARDFAAIAYQGEDKLLLPVENLHLIDRFIAESGALPTLDRLGKGGFARVKEGVKSRLYEIADEIIRRAADREVISAPIIDSDFEAIERFQSEAGFDYTADQARVIDEILSDLKSGKVMDRLLSGDVGFGKTEVAMNAIFAAYRAGFQAALIVPTTLLSHQHYENITARFAPFNIEVFRLDRFNPPQEKQRVLGGLKSGAIGVVVGTHALLSAQFKNLALMVVDEEHKFGVKQKEALKDKSKHLHLLSMSATPIPRSLNMALSQIKQMSEILTPPTDREDIRTIVKSYDPKIVKEAVLREIRRGGQIFYIFNRIAGIEAKRRAILEILPNLRVLVLHSQIDAAIAEAELLRFEAGEYDMLLSTTIVESGIHIPNANTIIIDGADRFGLADLHQLRGRVGRSRRQGFSFFLIENEENLTEEAKKRLLALENNSYLGGGSALAYHDLEIRGGGNILGANQSGHIKQIGYSLYLKMLEDALSELGGRQKERKNQTEIRLQIKAYISEERVAEERIRLELYRRFSLAESLKEVYEIAEEIQDRFGAIDTITQQFTDLIAIKVLAAEHKISTIQNDRQNIYISFEDGCKISIVSPSKDDDDIIITILNWFKTLKS